MQWNDGAEGTQPTASGSSSTSGTPSSGNVWGGLDDLMSNSNGNSNANEKVSGNCNASDNRSAQQITAIESSGSASKSNWSSAGGNPGDSPSAAGGVNSGVISPGGSSNDSASGISASDSKLISQWIGEQGQQSGGESQPGSLSASTWGSSGVNNASSNSNWGTPNPSNDARGAWSSGQQQGQQQNQQQPKSSEVSFFHFFFHYSKFIFINPVVVGSTKYRSTQCTYHRSQLFASSHW